MSPDKPFDEVWQGIGEEEEEVNFIISDKYLFRSLSFVREEDKDDWADSEDDKESEKE